MITLALEFSSAQRSAAVARGGAVLGVAIETGGFRVTNAFSLISQILAQSGIAREHIEVIAVGLGPGSYTGIRSAIAVAQGWQLARPIKLLGISSVEAIATRAQADGIHGRVNIAVDAQRQEFYLASWELSPNHRQEISPLHLIPGSELTRRLAVGEIFIGPDMDAPAGRKVFPDAATVAQLARSRTDFVDGAKLEPIYLRETSFVKAVPPLV